MSTASDAHTASAVTDTPTPSLPPKHDTERNDEHRLRSTEHTQSSLPRVESPLPLNTSARLSPTRRLTKTDSTTGSTPSRTTLGSSAAEARSRAERELLEWEAKQRVEAAAKGEGSPAPARPDPRAFQGFILPDAAPPKAPVDLSRLMGVPAPTTSFADSRVHGSVPPSFRPPSPPPPPPPPPQQPLPPASLSHTSLEQAARAAEARLAEAEQRVQATQAEAAQLETLRRHNLALAEEEAVRMKRKVLEELEEREREWERHKEEELRKMKMKEAQLEEMEERLRRAEREHQAELQQADEELKRRALQTEEARRRTTQALEDRLRKELFAELEPRIRVDLEKELTARITNEVQEELHREFQRMCETMKVEVERARERMEVEMERALEPRVEARLLPVLKARVESETQQSILEQLQEASTATQLLKEELRGALDERDRTADEMEARHQIYQQEVDSLRKELETEKAASRSIASELASATELLHKYEEERKLYPLLKEVEALPVPWTHVNEQIEKLKKENSKLRADALFSKQEIDTLRVQLMHNIGSAEQGQ
eukprot:Sspe_Gene.83919::Locus_55065_Transcript_1_1_Confidence_1.000_Length_1708::g.83919::m.83919